MLNKIILLGLSLGMAACSSGGKIANKPATGTGEKVQGAFVIEQVAPYSADARVEANVKNECTDLGQKLADFTKSYATERGVEVVQEKGAKNQKTNNYVKIELVDVYSGGNAFVGHRKSSTVKAEIYSKGVLVDSMTFTRNSSGGFAAGYKGSCSVLGRTVKAIGNDISVWLKKYHI